MSGPLSAADTRRNLVALSRADFDRELAPFIDRPYRLNQIYLALHRRGVESIDEITELSLRLRGELAQCFFIAAPRIAERRLSADGTCKYLLRLHDSATIEAVDIPSEERRTLCISSQAGCALACTFCVTGYWGAGRDLSAGEIVAQVRLINRESRSREPGSSQARTTRPFDDPSAAPNIVFMGMGEPLLNLEAVRESLDLLTQSTSWKRVTVSTVGIIPALEEMASWRRRPNLAISLHAPDDDRRNEIMPINQTYPLADLLACLRRYPLERGRKITIEYLLIRHFNDRLKDADQIARLLRGLRAKVNLIPINPDPVLGEQMVAPDEATVERFKNRLRQRGLFTTVRQRRGDEVQGACGQLRASGTKAHGVRARLRQGGDNG